MTLRSHNHLRTLLEHNCVCVLCMCPCGCFVGVSVHISCLYAVLTHSLQYINIYSQSVCVCYRALVRAVNICRCGEYRQISVENNICKGIDQWLIVDD